MNIIFASSDDIVAKVLSLTQKENNNWTFDSYTFTFLIKLEKRIKISFLISV